MCQVIDNLLSQAPVANGEKEGPLELLPSRRLPILVVFEIDLLIVLR